MAKLTAKDFNELKSEKTAQEIMNQKLHYKLTFAEKKTFLNYSVEDARDNYGFKMDYRTENTEDWGEVFVLYNNEKMRAIYPVSEQGFSDLEHKIYAEIDKIN